MKYMNNLIWLQFYLEQYGMPWMILHKIRLSVRLEKFRVSITVLGKKNQPMVHKNYLFINLTLNPTHEFQCIEENNAYWRIHSFIPKKFLQSLDAALLYFYFLLYK